jgi:hypothetical protein
LTRKLGLGLAIATFALGGVLAGCGGDSSDDGGSTSTTASGSDEEQIREVVGRYSDAVIGEDATALCEVISPADVKQAGGGGIEECAAASDTPDNILFSAPDKTDLVVNNVKIEENGKRATAYVEGNNFVTLVKVNGEWYVTFGAALAG